MTGAETTNPRRAARFLGHLNLPYAPYRSYQDDR
jgi:hypothetical protein